VFSRNTIKSITALIILFLLFTSLTCSVVAQEKAGYDALQEIFTDPLRKGAERIEVAAGENRSKPRRT